MKYLIEDPNTKVITAFVEGFKDVHKFAQAADLALKKNTVVKLMV